MAYAIGKEKGVDILVAGEPNLTTIRGGNWIKDKNNDVAVLLINRRTRILAVTRGKGRITLDLDDFRLTCCYISPNCGFQVFRQHVEEAFGTVDGVKETVILGDINAKSPEWGSSVWENRGELWTEWLGTKGMVVLNDGKEPTWRRGDQFSYIDVTSATRGVAKKIAGWKVLPDESLSDNGYVYFEIQGGKSETTHTWGKWPAIDEERLKCALIEEFSRATEETLGIEQITNTLKRVQETSEIRRAGRQVSLPYWWTGEIERARENCIVTRRTLLPRHRRIGGNDVTMAEREEEYKNARRTLARHIRSSKRLHWKNTCEELEEDIWGKGYQIVTKTIKGGSTSYELPHEKKVEIARQLFPRVKEEETIDQEDEDDEQPPAFPPFTTEEILEAVGWLKRKKRPGPDGVMAVTLQEAVKIAPDTFTKMYNGLARNGLFPRKWKKARLVLVWKGKCH